MFSFYFHVLRRNATHISCTHFTTNCDKIQDDENTYMYCFSSCNKQTNAHGRHRLEKAETCGAVPLPKEQVIHRKMHRFISFRCGTVPWKPHFLKLTEQNFCMHGWELSFGTMHALVWWSIALTSKLVAWFAEKFSMQSRFEMLRNDAVARKSGKRTEKIQLNFLNVSLKSGILSAFLSWNCGLPFLVKTFLPDVFIISLHEHLCNACIKYKASIFAQGGTYLICSGMKSCMSLKNILHKLFFWLDF